MLMIQCGMNAGHGTCRVSGTDARLVAADRTPDPKDGSDEDPGQAVELEFVRLADAVRQGG